MDRGGNEGRRFAIGGGIGGKILQLGEVLLLGGDHLVHQAGQIAVFIRSRLQVGGVIRFLEHGVDDRSLGIDQKHVVVAELGHDVAEHRVMAAMHLGIGAAIACGHQQLLLADRMGIGGEIERLQGAGLRLTRQIGLEIGGAGVAAREPGQEDVAVVGVQGLGCSRRRGCLFKLLERGVKLLHRRHDRKVFAQRLSVILNIAKIAFNLIGLRGSNAGELIENPVGEVDLAAAIAQQCREQCGKAAGQQEHQDQLRLDAQLI